MTNLKELIKEVERINKRKYTEDEIELSIVDNAWLG